MKYFMIAQTTPAKGKEEEFNDWYDNVHLAEVLSIPGFEAAQRYQVASGKAPHAYYAVYTVEAEDTAEVWKRASALDQSMTRTDVPYEAGAFILRPMGPKKQATVG
ncbi:DUF4286 family protein [Rhodococcus sp. MSC1_016]|jgi:heme-degrading monooxygenase HmoA|uniref:DUF4286 family protein n=1 Tax=Rhodococcus sp. MSC1_016 TaxID=2909266 RepID=UPI00202F7753|nr:DUF4286 family protein [Rhodococcus sp. MSC1_016]